MPRAPRHRPRRLPARAALLGLALPIAGLAAGCGRAVNYTIINDSSRPVTVEISNQPPGGAVQPLGSVSVVPGAARQVGPFQLGLLARPIARVGLDASELTTAPRTVLPNAGSNIVITDSAVPSWTGFEVLVERDTGELAVGADLPRAGR